MVAAQDAMHYSNNISLNANPPTVQQYKNDEGYFPSLHIILGSEGLLGNCESPDDIIMV